MLFDRDIFFDIVRDSLFDGAMTQQQVDGMNHKMTTWENNPLSDDVRFIAYPFATSYHETARTMWPIEEYGKGEGKEYGKPDPVTGKKYYGRGDVQLTWADNYKKATEKLGLLPDMDLYWHPENALQPNISAAVMYRGMTEGWFTGKRLDQFFNTTVDDPTGARIIINNDVKKNGALVAGFHDKFLYAFKAALMTPISDRVVNVTIEQPRGVRVKVTIIDV